MIVCNSHNAGKKHPPNFTLAIFSTLIMLVFNIFCFKIPSIYATQFSTHTVNIGYKKPSLGNATLWTVYADHLDIDSLTLDGVGVRPSGGPYVALTLRGAHFKNFSFTFPNNSFRGRLTTRINTTINLSAAQGVQKLELRSLTANITLLGVHLGRWTIDAGIVPNKLLKIIHLPRIGIPGFLLKKISLDKVEIKLYYIEVPRIFLSGATINYQHI